MEFLTGVPTVDQALEEITLSHDDRASVHRTYEQQGLSWPASLESLHASDSRQRKITGWPVIPPELPCSDRVLIHSVWAVIFRP